MALGGGLRVEVMVRGEDSGRPDPCFMKRFRRVAAEQTSKLKGDGSSSSAREETRMRLGTMAEAAARLQVHILDWCN